MKAKELRIGNLIIFYNDIQKTPRIVDYISGEKIGALKNMGFPYDSDYFLPIQLTSEILEVCGFEKQVDVFVLNRFMYEIYDSTQAKLWWRGRYLGIVQNIGELHQLQNLYFSLTGEELEIDIEKLKTIL